MQDRYFMSVGYPIGLNMDEKIQTYYSIELRGDFVSLSLNSYNVWKYCFFDIKEYNSFASLGMTNKEINDAIDDLKNNKVLVEMTSATYEIYLAINQLVPFKNGFGLGLEIKDANALVVTQGQKMKLTTEEWYIWSLFNGNRTVKQIIDIYKEERNVIEQQAEILVVNAILTLKTMDLLRMNRKILKKDVKNAEN